MSNVKHKTSTDRLAMSAPRVTTDRTDAHLVERVPGRTRRRKPILQAILILLLCFCLGPHAYSSAQGPQGEATGILYVSARPWARCTVVGKTQTTKARFRVPVGPVMVLCEKAGITKTKIVHVKKDRTSSVFFDFTK